MSTDYIIFVHGVNTRNQDHFNQQADKMFDEILLQINRDSAKTFKKITLFWGDIAEESIKFLTEGLDNSLTWKQFWFRKFRQDQVINFVGDAALYLSRSVSVQIINRLIKKALEEMELTLEEIRNNPPQNGDRLHLVTHSWGTVILFDIMFADRWESADLNQDIRDSIYNLRSILFGLDEKTENKEKKMRIASIHTMGSPISLFNLLNASGARSFNLTPNLKKFLDSLYTITNKPLPWYNYAHPNDPIAYPLKGVMDLALTSDSHKVNIQDIITPTNPLASAFGGTNASIVSLIWGGDAHGSYWTTPSIIKTIGEVIKSC